MSAPEEDSQAAATEPMSTTIREAGASLSEFDCPFQPKDFKFPTGHFRTDKFTCAFKLSWFEKFPWIHYVKDGDSLVCFSCVTAVEKKLVSEDSARIDSPFDKGGGFTNWHKATQKFTEHEKSQLHIDSIQRAEHQSLPCYQT